MKKIIGVTLATALLAGSAFAADISFSYKGNNYFKSNDDDLKYDNDSRADCLSLGLSNDYAGAVADWDIEGGKLTIDSYYGWMNFAAISTQFTGGKWSSRYIDLVNTDAGDLDDEDFIGWKPGVVDGIKFVADKNGVEYESPSVATDSDNLTEKNLALVAAYTNKDALPGALMVKFGLVNSSWDSFTKPAKDNDGAYKRTNNYGFVGEVAFRQDNAFNVNLAVKSLKAHNYSFGLFFSPLMMEKLQATAGFSLGLEGNTTYKAEGDTGVEYAFDLRARYAVTDKLSITTAHNLSSYLTGVKSDDEKKWEDNKLAMVNQINATYALLDNMKFGLNLQHIITDFDASYPSANELIVSPSLAIAATEKATVTISARADWTNIGFNQGSETFDFTVPVIFSFNY